MQEQDILWKGVLEEVFDDFLRFFYPEADKIFDLSRGITFLDKELAQLSPQEGEGYSTKLVDKLAKVYTHDGEEKWVLIHLEIQGIFNKDFPLRMFTYYYRILDKYQQRIAACAVLTEPVLKPRTGIYEQEFLDTSIRYQFKVYKIVEQDEAALRASDNLFALVVLIAKSKFIGRDIKDPEERDKALLAFKRELLRELRSRSIPKKKINILLQFLKEYVRFENDENNKKFINEIQNSKTMRRDYGDLQGWELLKAYNRDRQIEESKRRAREKALEEARKEVGGEEAWGKMQERDRKKVLKKALENVHAEIRKTAREQIRLSDKEDCILHLLTLTTRSKEEIAELMDVSVDFVKQLHAELQEENEENCNMSS